MSGTPRTDAEFKLEAFFDGAGIVETVLVEFARQLETELAYKDKLIEQMREALNVLVASATPSGPLWHGSAEMQIARAALSAAERGE